MSFILYAGATPKSEFIQWSREKENLLIILIKNPLIFDDQVIDALIVLLNKSPNLKSFFLGVNSPYKRDFNCNKYSISLLSEELKKCEKLKRIRINMHGYIREITGFLDCRNANLEELIIEYTPFCRYIKNIQDFLEHNDYEKLKTFGISGIELEWEKLGNLFLNIENLRITSRLFNTFGAVSAFIKKSHKIKTLIFKDFNNDYNSVNELIELLMTNNSLINLEYPREEPDHFRRNPIEFKRIDEICGFKSGLLVMNTGWSIENHKRQHFFVKQVIETLLMCFMKNKVKLPKVLQRYIIQINFVVIFKPILNEYHRELMEEFKKYREGNKGIDGGGICIL